MALRLLIIHPDDGFRRHLTERMRFDKGRMLEASTAAEASELILRRHFDVILIGVTGSRQDSFALLSMIKDLRPLTEVILLSPLEDHTLNGSIQAMQLGAFDDLPVPLDIHTLKNRIAGAYQRKTDREKIKRSIKNPSSRSFPCSQSKSKN
jgi:DNA-binding NtrC family response regulator